MNIIKRLLLIMGLMVLCSVAAFAQTGKGDKKIKKPNPPVVIVNLDKKDDRKKPKEEKKKPGTFLSRILKEFS